MVEIVDVYDPTGQVRSSTTDDIACWLVDTNYDEESGSAPAAASQEGWRRQKSRPQSPINTTGALRQVLGAA